MKKLAAFGLFLLLNAAHVHAQVIQLPKDTTLRLTSLPLNPDFNESFYKDYPYRKPALPGQLNKNLIQYKVQPLYFYKKEGDKAFKEINPLSLEVMDLNTYKTVTQYLKSESGVKKYGKRGKNGVVLVTYQKWVQLLSEQEFYTKYNITGDNTHLEMYVDSALVKRSSSWVYSIFNFRKVNIEVDKETGMKYINIQTPKTIPYTHTVNIR